ncbi:MAG: ABC-2 transporter permease [Thermoanaerobacteraceae bacterium]|nr:ABC-2 transporter permease [Thermoanaerobacteraceae bacterium]
MWQLVVKDLYLQRRRIIWTLGIVLILLVAARVILSDAAPVIIFATAYPLTNIFTLQICYNEENNDSLAFLRSLPLSARQIVNSKFCAMLLITLLIWAVAFVGFISLPITNILGAGKQETAIMLITFEELYLVINSLLIFIYFHWGYTRMQLIFSLIMMFIAFGGMSLPKLFPEARFLETGLTGVQGAITGLIAAIILIFLFWFGSIKVLQRKELS